MREEGRQIIAKIDEADLLVPASQVQILDDWHVAGLQGTGSSSVRITDLEVPAHRYLSLPGLLENELPSFKSGDNEWLTRAVSVRTKVSYEDDVAPAMPSTIGRELMYAVAHAIHHYALIGVMCGLMGVPVPAGFGVAPSTLKHQTDEAKLTSAH